MTRKQKILIGMLICVFVIGGLIRIIGIYADALGEDRTYTVITLQNRDEYDWEDFFTGYGHGVVKVKWTNPIREADGTELYKVHTKGYTYYWTKAEIAKYLTENHYLGD